MGLIKAITGAAGGQLADQWREFFYCDALGQDILVKKGQKRTSDRSSNTKGNDNIITNGARIAVNEGQAMAIVEQGKVVEFSAEAGEFNWDTSTEPSIFAGGLGQGILESFKKIGERFTFGGDTGKDQRIYFFNLKEIMNNKYGTANPVPFRVVDTNIGLDVDIAVRCNGVYSYKIVDPILFYTNVCGNVSDEYNRSEIDSQLKSELLTALQPAFAKISAMGIRYSAVPAHTTELCNALNEELSAQWAELRGIKIWSFGMNTISASEEDAQMIKDMQKAGAMRDPNMAAAVMASATADAMRTAAGNENGAMAGFMGMGMANGVAGNQTANLFAMGQQQQQMQQPMQQQPMQQQPMQQAAPVSAAAVAAATWKCSCGHDNTGKFCVECGSPRPAEASGWTCSCGKVNQGKFCMECGSPKPADAVQYKCDKCGWEPEDPTNPPRFCPECGDSFGDEDIVK